MKIAILYDVLYPFSIGGGERTNWELARRLVARGHEVTLVSSRMWAGRSDIEREGVRCVGVCRWHARANGLGNRSIAQPVLFAFGTFLFLRRENFDVVVCCAFPYLAALAAKAALAFTRTPLMLMWFEARGLAAWMRQAGPVLGACAAFFEKWASCLSSLNQANSSFTAGRMVRLLGMRPESITIIHCGVDNASLAALTENRKEPAILTVSRLVPHKRIDTLIRAFRNLAGEFPDLMLWIVGSGVERAALESEVRESRLVERVVFMEHVPEESLQRLLGTARVFVLPSEQEGFGMVLVEAMAAGVPVIARRSPLSAAQDIIEDGRDGLLFDSDEALVYLLRRVLTNDDLAATLIAAGKVKAAENDWDGSIVPAFEAWMASATRRHGFGRVS
ncbi:hexosyltransferase [Planctomycetia bacterium]|nr:hexosyltransferase [Planctomycetia bacterium]